MKFSLNKLSEINAYSKALEKRVKYVKTKYIENLWRILYHDTPRDTGAAAASWNISVGSPNYSWFKDKTSNSYISINCDINDTLYIATRLSIHDIFELSVIHNRHRQTLLNVV